MSTEFHSTIQRWFSRLVQRLHKRTKARARGHVTLGATASARAREPFVVLSAVARCQHLGIVGLSGSGKTYFITHLIRQDIKQRTGFVLFDVHGDLADGIIRFLAERSSTDPEVAERTVILEPFDDDRSFGFNPLERSDHISPFLQAREFTYILRKQWKGDPLSPRTEELLHQALYTLSVNDETILSLPSLLTSKSYRSALVTRVPSEEARRYWHDRYERLSEKMQGLVREPILTRLAPFITDPQVRDILGQTRSTFSFRDAIRKGLWLIINLSQGRLGEHASILGSILFTKLELEVMAQARVEEKDRRLFVVYADELQNLTSSTFARLIAEARKYKIALVTGQQYWRQLDPVLRQAMLAVGTKVLFRVHYHDAVELAGELAADERNRYIKLLTILERGEAVVRVGRARPVLIAIPGHRPAKPTAAEVRLLKTESAKRYTTLRSQIHRREPQSPSPMHAERGNQLVVGGELVERED